MVGPELLLFVTMLVVEFSIIDEDKELVSEVDVDGAEEEDVLGAREVEVVDDDVVATDDELVEI